MFKQDLQEWRKVEREFASRLLKYDVKKIEFSEWRFPWRDVRATFIKDWKEVERTYEIKRDRQVEDTWNVVIEYMYKWQPSGIYTSESNYIIYKLWDKFYYTDRIRFIIELSKCLKADVCGWDNDNSQMWLVKRDVFNLLTNEL